MILASVTVFFLVLLDQIIKLAASEHLKGKPAVSLIPGIFELQYLENRGAAFGTLQNQRWFFILVVFIVLAALIWCFWHLPDEVHYRRFAFYRF